jgi:hypothetical protein
MEQFGYNDANKFGSAYDPYVVKNQPPAPTTQSKSITSTAKTNDYKSQPKKKRNNEEESSSEGSQSDSSSEEEAKSKKKAKKPAGSGLDQPKKPERTI